MSYRHLRRNDFLHKEPSTIQAKKWLIKELKNNPKRKLRQLKKWIAKMIC